MALQRIRGKVSVSPMRSKQYPQSLSQMALGNKKYFLSSTGESTAIWRTMLDILDVAELSQAKALAAGLPKCW
jgi:hypothetical protein